MFSGASLRNSRSVPAIFVRTLSERFGDQGGVPAAMGARVATPLPGPMDILTSSDAVRDPKAHEHWLRPLWSHVVPLKPAGSLPPIDRAAIAELQW